MLSLADLLKSIEDAEIDRTRSIEEKLVEEFLDMRNYNDNREIFDSRVYVKVVRQWQCTDTMVGLYAIFFDKEFAGFGYQQYQKGDMDFIWVSTDIANWVGDFIVKHYSPERRSILATIPDHFDFTKIIAQCDSHIIDELNYRQARDA